MTPLFPPERPVPLRAHHALCRLFYSGHGYSPAFSERMEGLIALTARDPETPFVLTDGADVLCALCPHRQADDTCETQAHVASFDRALLRLTGLSAGDVLSSRELTETVTDRILRPGKRKEVCGTCSWNALCEEEE